MQKKIRELNDFGKFMYFRNLKCADLAKEMAERGCVIKSEKIYRASRLDLKGRTGKLTEFEKEVAANVLGTSVEKLFSNKEEIE